MQVFIGNLPIILNQDMSDTYQAEDIRQLTEKVKEKNYFFLF
jgi:MoxR-like ATPase